MELYSCNSELLFTRIHVLGDEEMDDGMKEMDDHTGFPELLTKPHSKKRLEEED